MEANTPSEQAGKPGHPSAGQKAFALLVSVGTISYLVLITAGVIKPADRLSVPEVALLFLAVGCVGVTLKPGIIERLEKFELAGIKIDLTRVREEQVEVRKRQELQAELLNGVQLALKLLVGNKEREHLMNLYRNKTNDYSVTGNSREEIRRLRAVKLIQMRGKETVAGIPDKVPFDLAKYIELTEDGREFAARLA
jgi:hypothetical protein